MKRSAHRFACLLRKRDAALESAPTEDSATREWLAAPCLLNYRKRVELDHVIVFTTADSEVFHELEYAGFRVSDTIDHAGQGTSCRCLFFPDAFIELIWVRDVQEARANSLRLDQRRPTRGVLPPFGLAWRAARVGSGFWEYVPREPRRSFRFQFPPDHLNPAHPLAFAMVPKAGFTIYDLLLRKRIPENSKHFEHRVRPSGLRSVLFKGPGLSTPRFLPPTLQVSVQPSLVYETVISLTTPLPNPVALDGLVLR